jgi:hypothetical protein
LPEEARRSIHDLDFSTRIKRKREFFYKCKRCGGVYTLSYVLKATCPAVPADRRLTYQELVAITGKKINEKAMVPKKGRNAEAAMERRASGRRMPQRSKAQ